ncbi:hypothetical protein [Lysobacter capsici]|uniref:hypothetical protein n=1 Tax=Lysobacter capsici TaxID=435897 RepID=UPI001C004849|nr:hypothetical protein [Lysobacter capsici]QWF19065.1 hypothetical protein KME82_10165 [Lysobacter capsici]
MLATAAAIHCTVLGSRTVANAPAAHLIEGSGAKQASSDDDIAAPSPIATATTVTAVDR